MNSSELINVLFNSSFSAIAIVSKDGVIVDVNDKFCSTLGLSKRNLLRLKYSDLLFSENNENIDDEYEINNNPHGQRRFKSKYSKFVWLDYSLKLVSSDDMESFFVLFINPIYDEIETLNKLKDLEYRLNEAEIITKLGHWDWNILEDTLYWSDMMLKIFGKTKKNFTADYNAFIETVHPDDRKNVNIRVQEAIEKNIPFNMEYRIVIDGKVKNIDARGKVIFLDNTPTRMFGTCQDVTKLKKLQIKEKNQELLLMEQSKLAAMGEMLSAIAHQWRQPLNAIALSTQDFIFLSKHEKVYSEENLDNFKTEIMEQLEYMSSTIDEFRNFFKHDSSKELFNLLDLVKSVVSLYEAQLKSHEITLKTQIIKNSEVIEFDNSTKDLYDEFIITNSASELKQVLINCIANAKDAIASLDETCSYQKEIFLSARIEDEFVYVNICDFAGGIKAEDINKIFDPNFTTKEYGTGLGLYICKRIIEKSLTGSISYSLNEKQIDNHELKGSNFEIKIPVTLA